MARFAFGGVSAPLVGIAGATTMLPLGVVTTVPVVLAVGAFTLLLTRCPTRAGAVPDGDPVRQTDHALVSAGTA
jgi:DHA1 family bicyclomycin/chloramphenicol resistance-like MFS transporter